MDNNQIKTLCLKQVYGAALSDAERAMVDDYTQTAEGRDYLQESREMKGILDNVADIKIRPVDHEAMVESFERTVRESFNKTVFRPWWEANSPPMLLGLIAGLFAMADGWSVINTVLLGICVLWLITDYFQRYYYAKVLSRPDLYEYAKTSRKRSDQILQSLPGQALVAVFGALAIAVMAYVVYWGYREFGVLVPAIVIFVFVETFIIFIYQYRKVKRADFEVWDWWTEEIKE